MRKSRGNLSWLANSKKSKSHKSQKTSAMSQKVNWEIDRTFQLYSSEDQDNMNGADADASDLAGVQVKFEPDDPDYEQAVAQGSVSAGLLRSFPPTGMTSSQSAAQWSGSSSAVRTQMRKFMEDKTVDSSTAAQNVQNVIEDLLKKNEFLLAQNDALGFKPNSRRGRIPGEVGRSKEIIFPHAGQSSTFSVGHLTQGRITGANNRSSPQREQVISVPVGQLMRPKSPTRRCVILDKDRSHFNLALMESRVGCKESEKIFHVQEHAMVCAISSQTKFLNKEGRLVSSVDISYYWCNFCSFSTTNKTLLMQHVIEHRFHCKFCRYQSFSRADVIHHSVHNHPNFHETASITQYCTLLSDYLRIFSPKEVISDNQRKRKEPPDDNADGEQQSSKVSKNGSGKRKQKEQNPYSANYDLFDLNVEDLEETAEDESAGTFQDLSSKSSSCASSSFSVISTQPDPTPVSQASCSVASKMSQTPYSRSSSPGSDTTQPVITQIFSASTIPPSLASEIPPSSNVHQPACSSGRSVSPCSTPSPLNPNNVGAGTMQQLRSTLYWSCGYCSFTSKSQRGIKDHSVGKHNGKPQRYVALIRSDENSTPPPSKLGSGEDSNSSADQRLEMDLTEEAKASTNSTDPDPLQDHNSTAGSTHPDEPPVLVKQEPLEQDESISPIKVRFPTPRNHAKDNSSLKCYHCDYSSRLLGPLRNHILTRHKGKCLIGHGGLSSRVFMCVRTDCTFRSSSSQTFLNHSQECTPWMLPEDAEAQVEGHLLECLRSTVQIAEETQSLSTAASGSMTSSKVSYENFSCIYCKCQFASNKKQAKQHVLRYHGSKCLIVRNVTAHRKKKRSVFFCRWCPWEGEQRVEHDLHAEEQPQAVAEQRLFQCTSCGWIASNDTFVQEHVSLMHANEGGAAVITLGHDSGQRTIEERYIKV